MEMNMRKKANRIFKTAIAVLLSIVMVLSSAAPTTQAAINKNSEADSTETAVKTSVTVATQAELTKALADKSITTITIKMSKKIKLTIPDKEYKNKTLIIDSANASVVNGGTFKKIVVTNAVLFTENAKGNNITINDKKVTLKVSKIAKIKSITVAGDNAKCNIVAEGKINKIVLTKKAAVTISGKFSDIIPVQLQAAAKGSTITSSVKVAVRATGDSSITLEKGAEGSTIILAVKGINLKVENKTAKSAVITTPEGKEIVAAGKTIYYQNGEMKETENSEPTKAPEIPEPTITPEIPKPTVTPDNTKNIVTPTPGGTNYTTTYYTVDFDSDGGTPIASISVAGGGVISNLPTPQKSNSIFLGWYTDAARLNEFTEESSVYSNMTLYAKYSEIETEQENLNDTYTLTEQGSGLSFAIVSSDTSMSADGIKSALALTVADGSGTPELTVSGSNGDYVVAASNGFTEGASYILTLSDSRLTFKDKESTIRKCSFNIAKGEIYNIELNQGIIYIPEDSVKDITKNGAQVVSLSIAVVDITEDENSDASTSGTFTYTGSDVLNIGDVLCIYSGDKPEAPQNGEDDSEYIDDNIAYVKVADVTGSIGSQIVSYTNTEPKDVLFMPDVLPIAVGEGSYLIDYTAASENTEGSLTASITDLDFSTYSNIGLSAETTIDEGDYLALYNDNSGTPSVVYGKVTGAAEQDGNVTVTFTATTENEMKNAMDYYSRNNVDSDALIDDVDVAVLEEDIEQQVQESGFAEDASTYLTALALQTDGFQKFTGDDLESFSIKMADGTDADLNVIKCMSTSSSMVTLLNLKVDVEINDDLQKLDGSGMRCAVTVSFEVPIKKVGDDGEFRIAISATFVEEIQLSIVVSANDDWDYLWGFIPYIAEYEVNANVDVYDYTGINFSAKVTSSAYPQTIDISKEIQNILSYTDSNKITSGVQKLFDTYSDMMESEADWIDIFDKNIKTIEQHPLYGILNIKTAFDFVVSANVNVALGCNFEYKSGTRYCFWAKLISLEGGSDTIDLMDEQYAFQFYVMGSLGLRAGIRIEVAAGILSVDVDSIGLIAEVGAYVKLYGYFFYQLYSVNDLKRSKMSGAMYLDFGIYLETSFKAQAFKNTFQYNPTIYSHEWPLLSAGKQYNVYDFAYEKPSKTIKLKYFVKSFTLPSSAFNMTYLDLKEGGISTKNYEVSDFNITFSDKHFTIEDKTVKVNVPKETHRLECDMTITWKSSALAFSSVPIARTFHITWDDLNEDGYTITYNSLGGSMVDSVTQLYGTTVTAPANPQKTGYTFDGWYSLEDLKTKYNFSTMPAENIVLYAKWTANTDTEYKVEYYLQNLENDSYTLYATEVQTGTTGATISAAAKTYTGFSYNSSAKGTVSSGIIAAEGSLVLKQYYRRNSYILTFKPENDGNDIVKTLKFGSVISAPTVVRTGYTFKSWDNPVTATMPTANTTYTAQWIVKNYSIVFNSNGGSTVAKITQAYGTIVNEPAVPTNKGFTFGGWYSDAALSNAYTFATMRAQNITLYAKWNPDPNTAYKVLHYQQNVSGVGYTLQDTEDLKGTTGTTITATAKTYEGFTYNSNADGTAGSGTVKADGSLTLKLYYVRNNYTLTFKTDNGEDDIVNSVIYGADISAPTPDKSGYSFNGWDETVAETMPAANTTYTAQWTPNDYTIEFNSNGGSSIDQITQAYGTNVNAPAQPTRPGFTFGGWYGDAALMNAYTFSTMPAENITIFVKWNPNPSAGYLVQHYQQNVTGEGYTLQETENLTAVSGAAITATAKSYEGFTYNSNADGTISSGTPEADGSLTLKLYYDRNSYTLTFKPDNGEADIVHSVLYGADISAPSLTKLGYSFNGWGDTVAKTMPAANTTYIAQWTVNNYTIEFNSNGGSAVDKITQAFGTTVNAPTKPTKTDLYFGGWYTDEALTNAYTFSTMPAQNITLYARWTIQDESGRLEGENGILYGYASIEENPDASNGAHVGYIDTVGAGVSFENLNASNSIVLCYAGEMSGTVSIYVNGVKIGTISLLSTNSYMAYAIVEIDGLNLIGGDTLSFQYDLGDTPFNIDYIAYNVIDTVPIVTIQN